MFAKIPISRFVKIITILIAELFLSGGVLAQVKDCPSIEICPDKSCKPSKDCAAIGDAAIGTDKALARARCETQLQQELSACRAQKNEEDAACSLRQYKQASECLSAQPNQKIPGLCDTIETLIAASKQQFNEIKGKSIFKLSNSEAFEANKSVPQMTRCDVNEITTLTPKLIYYECRLTEANDLAKATSKMLGTAKSVQSCLGGAWQLQFFTGNNEGNQIWLFLDSPSNAGRGEIRLRAYKTGDQFFANFYLQASPSD